MADVPGTHTEHEDEPWTVLIPDHPGRTESADFRRAKQTMHKVLAAVTQQASGAANLVRSISV